MRPRSASRFRTWFTPHTFTVHADKNAHRLDEAQERFKEVQNAYEILSDKHERAWYDGHREQILRSGDRHLVCVCVCVWGGALKIWALYDGGREEDMGEVGERHPVWIWASGIQVGGPGGSPPSEQVPHLL